MAINTEIGWTDHTANPWWGCYEVHSGCDNCYAKAWAKRMGFSEIWDQQGPRRAIKDFGAKLDTAQRKAAAAGRRDFIFSASMADIFEKSMPVIDHKHQPMFMNDGVTPMTTGFLREQFFNQIDGGRWPNLFFLLLTKRPSNINSMIPARWREDPPLNVAFGTSPVDQPTADKLVSQLLNVKGFLFLSIEPQLDLVSLMKIPLKAGHRLAGASNRLAGTYNALAGIFTDSRGRSSAPTGNVLDWVICGGESGPQARPPHPSWFRSLRDECNLSDTPFFFKQWGEWLDTTEEELPVRGSQNLCWTADRRWLGAGGGGRGCLEEDWKERGGSMMSKVGKKAAGNLLDGVLHEAIPLFEQNSIWT